MMGMVAVVAAPVGVWRTKMAQFRTHDLTKELAYVSTQQQANSTHFFSIILVSIVSWPGIYIGALTRCRTHMLTAC
jgi:hypothetical protein